MTGMLRCVIQWNAMGMPYGREFRRIYFAKCVDTENLICDIDDTEMNTGETEMRYVVMERFGGFKIFDTHTQKFGFKVYSKEDAEKLAKAWNMPDDMI